MSGNPKRCEVIAKKGTGTGSCDTPLDSYLDCPNARNHLEDEFDGPPQPIRRRKKRKPPPIAADPWGLSGNA